MSRQKHRGGGSTVVVQPAAAGPLHSKQRQSSSRGAAPISRVLSVIKENDGCGFCAQPPCRGGHRLGGGSQQSSRSAGSLLATSGAGVVARRNVLGGRGAAGGAAAAPWAAPSVRALGKQMRVGNRASQPLLVEGPAGDVLNAAGSKRDHALASDVLAHAQRERMRAGVPMPTGPPQPWRRREGGGGRRLGRGGASIVGGGCGGRAPKNQRSFGAVYEHRDCFGRPKFISDTHDAPERAFAADKRKHKGVRDMLTYQSGKSSVVWAGTGTFPLGPKEMASITSKIVARRAETLQIQKLSGPKPYSRHGW